MNFLRNVRLTALAVVLSAVAALSSAAPAHAGTGDTYAAIAYSANTGSAGYAYHASTELEAELDALAQCRGDDAKVVVTVRNGFAALSVGDDGSYGYAWGTSQSTAENIALSKCLDVGGVRPRILVSIYAGD